MQPGETITPGTPPTPQQQPEKQEVPVVPSVEPEQQPTPVPTPDPTPTWQFTDNEEQPVDSSVSETSINPVTWTASEFIAHTKGASWFLALGLVLCVFAGGIYFFTRDFTAPIVIAVAGITFGVFAGRSPRVLQYTVDSKGIRIGDKFYGYSDFRSFDINDDAALPAILLLPLKRFLPPITVFYDEKEEDAILSVIGSYLPHEQQQPDAVDRLMRRIRF